MKVYLLYSPSMRIELPLEGVFSSPEAAEKYAQEFDIPIAAIEEEDVLNEEDI